MRPFYNESMDITRRVAENLEKVISFVKLCDENSFSKAARLLGLAQSSLSSQIKSLETALDTLLLVRRSGGFDLTREGEALLKLGKSLESDINGFAKDWQNLSTGVAEIRIGTKEPFAIHVWPRYLHTLSRQFPTLTFRFVLRNSNRELIRLLIEDEVDFVVAPSPSVPSEIKSYKLFSDRYAFYAAEEGQTDRLIIFSQALTATRLTLGESIEKTYHGPSIETESFDSSLAMALEGLGVAVLPETVALRAVREGKLREISLPKRIRPLLPVEIRLCVAEKRLTIPTVRAAVSALLHAGRSTIRNN